MIINGKNNYGNGKIFNTTIDENENEENGNKR